MKRGKVNVMGMELERWSHKDSFIDVAEGDDWATVYMAESKVKEKGHMQELLLEAKKHYEDNGKKFGGSVALNPAMRHIYQKLGIKEYR